MHTSDQRSGLTLSMVRRPSIPQTKKYPTIWQSTNIAAKKSQNSNYSKKVTSETANMPDPIPYMYMYNE